MFGMTYVSNFKSIRFFSIISFLILISCIIPTEQTKDDLYIKLEKEIMCPVCDGQTLDQSQSLIAEDMKNSIKEKISEGYNEEEIKNYFIDIVFVIKFNSISRLYHQSFRNTNFKSKSK